jgi:hypothetical protein
MSQREAAPLAERKLRFHFRTGSMGPAQSEGISNEEGPPMKLRIAGLVAVALVLVPGAASAQWYERGPRHDHGHQWDQHHHHGYGDGHGYGYERRHRDGRDHPVHIDQGHHHRFSY